MVFIGLPPDKRFQLLSFMTQSENKKKNRISINPVWSEALLRPRTSSRSVSKGIGCAALTRSHPHTGARTPRDTDASPRAVSPYSDFVALNIKGGNKVFLERESKKVKFGTRAAPVGPELDQRKKK